ncbi:MAG: Histone H2A.Z-specific chaperone [Thelocarpon superellum]|nr:MAG: Histone H2A.Z-specific chaperone [Thelocarpon superellum]
MADHNGVQAVHDTEMQMAQDPTEAKGKGKAAHEAHLEEEEESSDEETGAEEEEEEVAANPGDEEEEDMTEIDQSNIINDGKRTRGKTIDFAKAAENAGDDLDEDEDDDEDFEEHDEDAMQE